MMLRTNNISATKPNTRIAHACRNGKRPDGRKPCGRIHRIAPRHAIPRTSVISSVSLHVLASNWCYAKFCHYSALYIDAEYPGNLCRALPQRSGLGPGMLYAWFARSAPPEALRLASNLAAALQARCSAPVLKHAISAEEERRAAPRGTPQCPSRGSASPPLDPAGSSRCLGSGNTGSDRKAPPPLGIGGWSLGAGLALDILHAESAVL